MSQKSKIIVTCGPMFAGKTTELIRSSIVGKLGKKKVQIFKPSIDTRYDAQKVVSHENESVDSMPVSTSFELESKVCPDTEIVLIDEAQFFDEGLPDVCQQLADRGRLVHCFGLDMDYKRRPFPVMANLLAIAGKINKIHAVCVECGETAFYSHRTNCEHSDTVLVGGSDKYEPLCRKCYLKATAEHMADETETPDPKGDDDSGNESGSEKKDDPDHVIVRIRRSKDSETRNMLNGQPMEPIQAPFRMSKGAAGFDLRTDIDLFILPMQRRLAPTGFCFEIPEGYEGQIRPRSGLASKNGLTVVNSPGTVDSDYRGEVMVSLVNLGTNTLSIPRGERIAQMVISRVPDVLIQEVEELSETERGENGFGSTGTV